MTTAAPWPRPTPWNGSISRKARCARTAKPWQRRGRKSRPHDSSEIYRVGHGFRRVARPSFAWAGPLTFPSPQTPKTSLSRTGLAIVLEPHHLKLGGGVHAKAPLPEIAVVLQFGFPQGSIALESMASWGYAKAQ